MKTNLNLITEIGKNLIDPGLITTSEQLKEKLNALIGSDWNVPQHGIESGNRVNYLNIHTERVEHQAEAAK